MLWSVCEAGSLRTRTKMAPTSIFGLILTGMTSSWFLLSLTPASAGALTMPSMAAAVTTAKPHGHGAGHLRTVCYMAGWARYRKDPIQFHPEDVDTSLCSHLIFAFALLDKSGLQVVPADPSDMDMYQRLTSLKREKPTLKVLVGVGGWVMGSEEFTRTVSSSANMHSFAQNAISFLHRFNFDGLDLDWEYPGDRGSPPGDRERFTTLVQVLQKEFLRDHHLTNRTRLTLTAAISPAPGRVQNSYQLPDIAKYVEFFNLLTYDLHGSWDSTVGHHTALYSATQNEDDSIDYMVNFVLNSTIPPQKLNLGLAFYGRSFNLTDPLNARLGAGTTGPGAGGQYAGEDGFMMYTEVCKLLTEHNDTITASGRLPNSQTPYVVDGNRWTGYDDVTSIKEKVDYAVQNGLGGVSIWAIDMDDFHGVCGGGHYPLMHAIRHQMHESIIG